VESVESDSTKKIFTNSKLESAPITLNRSLFKLLSALEIVPTKATFFTKAILGIFPD
jgi:hypothetical protein